MNSIDLNVDTSQRRTVDLTDQVRNFCRDQQDLEDVLNELLPRDRIYTHHHGSTGHGADHLLPALVSPSITIPADGGLPALGQRQRVVLVDL
jgi:thiamine phosphate synthase YjbQ (UPF0047 family)